MTSRERVKRAFTFEKADRMPIDYFGNGGINAALIKHFNTDYDGVLDALNVDFRPVWAEYKGKPLYKAAEGYIFDPVYGFYMSWIEHSSGGYWDICNFPLKDAPDEVIASYPVPDPNDFDYSAVDAIIKKYPGRALYAGNAGMADMINTTGRVMGMEQALMNFMTGDEATLSYINRLKNMELAQLEKTIQRAKGGIDFMWIGEDLGTQIAPMVSMELYNRVIRPVHQRFVDLAKTYKLPIMIHTCGSSSWAYDEFIKMGINAVDTLQPEAVNMSPEYLIKNFCGRLAFHGSISTAGPLAYGTVEDVEKDIKNKCDIYRPTKAYMISPTHAIQDNSPLENVLKMYECAVKYGQYGD